MTDSYFTKNLTAVDPDLFKAIEQERSRQQDHIELIASENFVSRAVMEAQGSILTNKYAEGYPGRRYYGGCQYVDIVEDLARERAKKLFNCEYINVQPHSGSQANQAVFLALLKPGDTILGMDLSSGGHLTHGSSVNQSGKWFNIVSYGVDKKSHLIDYDEVRSLALTSKPKVIIAGYSAYSRPLDFKKFRAIADEVGAYLFVDMAHFAGLVATGFHSSPLPYADVVTTTTHKTLRGPRGGMILSNNPDLYKKLNSAIFPGMQGGPLMHVIAAKAVAFKEALSPDFKTYIGHVLQNMAAMGNTLKSHGFDLVAGGTDNHLLSLDLRSKSLKGNKAEEALERAGIATNKNTVPFDPESPMVTSGLRIGSPAMTTRGMGTVQFEEMARLMGRVLEGLQNKGAEGNHALEQEIAEQVKTLCHAYPIYTT